MSWRDHMGPASFRGVPFHIDVAERSGGRRTVRHQYPLRDEPYVEDMGLRGRGFPVEGYVVGDDYLVQRDALIAALEKFGPGELIHPHYGTVRVTCSTFRVRETPATEGGVARFSIEFEATTAEPIFPVAAPDAATKVQASAAAAFDAVEVEFAAALVVDDEPQFSLESLAAVIASGSAALDAALAPVVSGTQELAAIKRQMDEIAVGAVALVRKPLDTVAAFRDALASLVQPALTVRDGIDALLTAYVFTPAAARPPETTGTRVREAANYDATQRMIQRLVVIQAASLAPSGVYDSYDDAVAVRDAIAAKLDEQTETAGDDVYPALRQLRADLVKAVPGDSSNLARLVSYVPPYTVPSLVLAHRLYGDLSLEQDLLVRNKVEHPGFVLGERELEVLTRA